MTQPKPPKIGEPLDLTDEQLDQAAIVTPIDIIMGRALWHQHAPPKLVDLLDAAPEQLNA
jgi:hypothetical protein